MCSRKNLNLIRDINDSPNVPMAGISANGNTLQQLLRDDQAGSGWESDVIMSTEGTLSELLGVDFNKIYSATCY
jgi:hypothetical protein